MMEFLGSFYNPNLGYTLENQKGAEKDLVLTIGHGEREIMLFIGNPRGRSIMISIGHGENMDFQISIHLYCAIVGVLFTEFFGYTLENLKGAYRVAVLAIRCRKIKAFRIRIYFYRAIIGVVFAKFKIVKAFQSISTLEFNRKLNLITQDSKDCPRPFPTYWKFMANPP